MNVLLVFVKCYFWISLKLGEYFEIGFLLMKKRVIFDI